jgi:hypothetical protein
MEIQQVIAMSKETLAQFGKAGAPPSEAEYNAVYAAVTATERGRWFLAEFANRSRKADTDLILAAIARIDAAIRTGAAPQAAVQAAVSAVSPMVLPAVLPSVLPDEAIVAAAAAAPVRGSGGERDEEIAEESRANVAAPSPPPAETDQAIGQNVGEQVSGEQAIAEDAVTLSDKDYSDAVAAIAASLTTRLGKSAQDFTGEKDLVEAVAAGEPEQPAELPSAVADIEIAKVAAEAIPRPRVPQDNSQRWHIEGPDFVFGQAGADEGIAGIEPQRESAQLQSQLLGAEIMETDFIEAEAGAQATPEPAEAPAARREEPLQLDALAEAAPEPVVAEQIAPTPVMPPALEIVPLTEMARPQLRIAHEAAPSQRPLRYGSLTVSDALSEDEVIALFG